VVQHAQTPVDGKVAKAKYVGALHAKNHNHFGSPYADAGEGGELRGDLFIAFGVKSRQIQLAGLHLPGKIFDIAGLFKGHSQLLQLLRATGAYGVGIYLGEHLAHPPPYSSLRGGGNLLAYNVVDYGGEQVGICFPADMPDFIYRRAEELVPAFQIIGFCIALCEMQIYRPPFNDYAVAAKRLWHNCASP